MKPDPHCRVRSVRFRDGRELVRLRPPTDDDRQHIERRIRYVLDSHRKDYAGFALVIWASDGASSCDLGCSTGSQIPTILVPDFVRNRLLAERIETWTLDTLAGK